MEATVLKPRANLRPWETPAGVAAERGEVADERKDLERPRSIFVSDVHLGCKYANTESFLNFLESRQPDFLYLVGDIFDGWRLSRKWYWRETYSRVLNRLLEMGRAGTRIFYTPGNHDDFLRGFRINFGNLQLVDEVIHVTADGRRLLVMHGDQFDRVICNHGFVSRLGDAAYNMLMAVDRAGNWVWRRVGGSRFFFSKKIKQKVKSITNRMSDFEGTLTRYAHERGCDGIVCGHVHVPAIEERGAGAAYYNSGDWVENRTALIERHDGALQIIEVAD